MIAQISSAERKGLPAGKQASKQASKQAFRWWGWVLISNPSGELASPLLYCLSVFLTVLITPKNHLGASSFYVII